jgi:dTDP-L-rhamnose 4-epimerase
LIREDIRHADAVCQALHGVSAWFHFTAAAGAGQSMYELEKYLGMNTVATAALLEALLEHPVETPAVASGMSICSEGLYRAAVGSLYTEAERSLPPCQAGVWEVCGARGAGLSIGPRSAAGRWAGVEYWQWLRVDGLPGGSSDGSSSR